MGLGSTLRMATSRRILCILLATIVGELILIVLTTLAQEVLFNGIDYDTSSLSDIFFGGLTTFLAAVLAGMTAALIVRGRTLLPHLFISLLILLEMVYLVTSGLLSGPLWFDTLSGLGLIIGVWTGHFATRTYLLKS